MYSINISQSNVAIIRDLISNYEGKTHQIKPWFKKTEVEFKKRCGFDLINAPVIFKAEGMIWKLSFTQSRYPSNLGGHRYERACYLPIVSCGKYFDRLNKN